MAYYNREHKKLKLNNMQYLCSGNCAKILYNQEIILKEYYFETILNCRLTTKIFDLLKSIHNPHLIELFDIYSEFNLVQLIQNKIKIFPFIVDAYTAKYYSDNSLNILLESKEFLLDNFKELDILFKIFTENQICTADIKRDNTIISKEGIIIIDPDMFYTTKSSKDYVSTLNKKNLLSLFRSILIESIINEPDFIKYRTLIDNELVNIEITENTDIAYEISKKLKYLKKPIEIFKK